MKILLIRNLKAQQLALVKLCKSSTVSGIVYGDDSELSNLISRIRRSWSKYKQKKFFTHTYKQVNNTRTIVSSAKNFSAQLICGKSGDPLVAIKSNGKKTVCFPLKFFLNTVSIVF